MELFEAIQHRRSIRSYLPETITNEDLDTILQAGLCSASGYAIRPWEFIVVRNKETLKQLSDYWVPLK